MTAHQLCICATMLILLLAFVSGKVRYDAAALTALLTLGVSGIITTNSLFDGFSHPAVITVVAILIITRALGQSGLIHMLANSLHPLHRYPSLQIFALCLVVAVLSAFMNNVGALALMMPVAIRLAAGSGRPTSHLLMPLSFASLLGGLCTLIGTPPNIVISAYRTKLTGTPFGMFDFMYVGAPLAMIGLLFVGFIGWRLLPNRQQSAATSDDGTFKLEDYVCRVRLSADHKFIDKSLGDLESQGEGNISIIRLKREDLRIVAPSPLYVLKEDDELILEGGPVALKQFIATTKLEIITTDGTPVLASDDVGLWEVVILGDSTLNGVCLSTMNLHARFGIQVLGICRRGKRIVESLATLHLRIGDVLIIQGRRPDFERATSVLNCLPLADHSTKVNTARPWIRFGLFAAGVFCTTLGLLPPALAFTMVVMGLLTVGKFSGKDIMASMEWQVVILLGSLIPIGHAFASSGAAQYLTDYVMSGVKDLSMPYILAGLMIITMLLSDLMNNAATAIIMAPIGVALAHKYHAPIDPFLMTVAIGSSATFLTPIGHQSNLLVMAPGGYKFFDYARMGLWLDILLVMMAVPLIYWAWF